MQKKPSEALESFFDTSLHGYTSYALRIFFLLILLAIALRILWPASDPWKHLDWSSGLLTDEGFYLHNARNLILFGRERTDDFNNALLSPTLNAVQIVVFRQFGVGIVQARSISVIAGLLTLPLFFAGLNRACGVRTAMLGTVFLGLDPLPLLYGRMALLDTPAAFVLVGAFYCWTRANGSPESDAGLSARIWLSLCGTLLGLAFATRGLCLFLVPVPLLVLAAAAFCRKERADWGRLRAFAGGLAFVLLLYFCLWAFPHRTEIAQTNAFYLRQQLLPHSLRHFARIVTRTFFGESRGLAPALVAHTPVLFALALAGLLWRVRVWREQRQSPAANSLFLGGWLLSGWLTFSVIGYAPSRYYVLFFPALAAIAALAFRRLPEIFALLYIPDTTRTLFGSFFAYHFALQINPFAEIQKILFVAGFTLVAALLLYLLPLLLPPSPRRKSVVGKGVGGKGKFIFALWLLIGGIQLQDWLRHIAYSQANVERWLIANLPPDAVLLGDVAPGVSVNSGFVSAPVIPGLCNEKAPQARSASPVHAIIILDGDRREVWWDSRYPARVTPERQAAFFPDVVGFPVGIYIEAEKGKK